MKNTMRINKFLASYAGVSRRKADALIDGNEISINNHRAKHGEQVNIDVDKVNWKGQVILTHSEEFVYYAIDKPVGVVSTTNDDRGRKTVLDLIPKSQFRIYPVGRLDVDSQGLLLLTNDGGFAYALTHPSKHVAKVYEVLVNGMITAKAVRMLKKGVPLIDGSTAPTQTEIIKIENDKTWLRITLHEGRNRQIRRMMKHLNYEVLKLVRVQIGNFHIRELQQDLWIKLTQEQVDRIKD